ncbi:hypothetical protein [Virgisporangium aurantiacum]|uniref:Uncharacterized protein n=1 Tax=Virgisporangium aurantiacum TaxID=175570 RepID=A0A8J3ZFN8_9ACTN|nr:hypothetical protein [Virgisporangium aurantiacum]GIJ60726.1 hypothetical protein Vau01_082420 [Virgisporangium aurantiacum]
MGDAARDRFARQVAIALRVAGGTDIEYDADEFCLRYTKPGGAGGWIANLHNLYHEWGSAKQAEQGAEIRRFADALATTPESLTAWEMVADRLRPVLNSPQLAEYEGIRLLVREFHLFVNEMVVIDHPKQMQYVHVDQPAEWGVSADEVFARARENIATRANWPRPDEKFERKAILRMPETGSDYWVSHLLVDGWLAAMGEKIGGRPVAFTPHRSSGLTIVDDDPDTVKALLEHTEKEYLESARYVSPLAYTIDDAGRVVPFAVPRGDPLWNAVHRSETLLASKEYDAQKAELDDDFDIDEDEPDGYVRGYFGGYQVGTRDDGSVFSVSTWGEGVWTLLPKTDFVAVINEAHDTSVVPFETVVDTIGLVPHPKLYPPRYRTPQWMSDQQLATLRAQAVEP